MLNISLSFPYNSLKIFDTDIDVSYYRHEKQNKANKKKYLNKWKENKTTKSGIQSHEAIADALLAQKRKQPASFKIPEISFPQFMFKIMVWKEIGEWKRIWNL